MAVRVDDSTIYLIKYLLDNNYPDKVVSMITHAKQPYVSKIKNKKLHKDKPIKDLSEIKIDKETEERLKVARQILNLPEIYTTGTTKQDVIYIQVLKFFMVDKKKVYEELYFHLSKREFNKYWGAKNANLIDFDTSLINVDKRAFIDLILDYVDV